MTIERAYHLITNANDDTELFFGTEIELEAKLDIINSDPDNDFYADLLCLDSYIDSRRLYVQIKLISEGLNQDTWLVKIAHRDNAKKLNVTFDYTTGISLRRNGKPNKPATNEVLSNLLSDTRLGLGLFADFCSDFGLEHDSRSALDRYLACQDTALKLREVGLCSIVLAALMDD